MKKHVAFLLLFGLSQFSVFAQNKITGKVTTPDGQVLPGVNVQVSGTTQGTATDVEGKYVLNAASEASLVFSYIGYVSQTIKVDNRSVIDIVLELESKNLSEVVVTALGIKREAKTLGYATATVNADQISTNRSPNVMSSLQGTRPGLQHEFHDGYAAGLH